MSGLRQIIASFIVLAMAGAAWPWGPNTEISLVMGAAQVISRDGAIPLNNLRRDIRLGASLSDTELNALYPIAVTDPYGAIELEMNLLQSVRGSSIDPYYAFRLGALGKLVARVTAPLYDGPPAIRSQYYADVERSIERVNLKPAPRRTVDPGAYFPAMYREANSEIEVVIRDYQDGLGLAGMAGGALANDASRSVNAVADVWFTILGSRAVVANLPDAQTRDFIIGALRFYIDRGRTEEINAAYRRLRELGSPSPELRKQIGDMFFEASLFERAIEEYEAVLAVDPVRRDVVERLAEYYVAQGDEALGRTVRNDETLALARTAYEKALDYDRLHPSAQEKLITTRMLIREREERREASERALLEANTLRTEAENLALRNETAGAISRLFEAQMLYGTVTEEFVRLSSEARMGTSNVTARINQLKGQLIENASSLSGAGAGAGVQSLARDASQTLDQEALRALVQHQYDRQLNQMRGQLRDQVLLNR